jgi:hypothetical protein
MNGKLVIRVGGGYMLIDEFLKNYAENEGGKNFENYEEYEQDSPKSKYLKILNLILNL